MLITKEKITALVATVLALGIGARSLAGWRAPGPVPEPAESEAAVPYDPEDELLPALAPKRVWVRKDKRNPFSVRDSYSDQAPVPLSIPPAAEPVEFIPSLRLKRGFDGDRVIVEAAPKIDPEPKVRDPFAPTEGG